MRTGAANRRLYLFLAALTAFFGDSNNVAQFFQITCDALAAVIIFLIGLISEQITALMYGKS